MKKFLDGIDLMNVSLVLSVMFTIMVSGFIFAGSIAGISIAVASFFAFIGWRYMTRKTVIYSDKVIFYSILIIMTLMAQNIEEWIFGFSKFFSVNLFAIYSIGLAAFFLFGIFGFSIKLSIGKFAAWLIGVWAIVQTIMHYLAPILINGKFGYFPGQAISIIVLILGILLIKTLLKNNNERVKKDKQVTIAKPYHAIAVLLFIFTYAVVFFNQAGPRPTLIVCGSMFGGFILWLRTTYKIRINYTKVIPIYLMTLVLFFIHITEEFITDFPGEINSIFNSSWSLGDFVILIALLGPIIWTSGILGLLYKHPFGQYLTWFVFFGMLIGEPTHYLVFPMVQSGGYNYFSGMWTALFPMIPAIYGVYYIFTECKNERKLLKNKNSNL